VQELLERRPKRRLPGLINMKVQAIRFGPLYARRDSRFMDRMAELMNLSDGRRSVAEIARVVNYEIGTVDPVLVAEMFGDMQEFGFVEFI
jgi:hypothetical protein